MKTSKNCVSDKHFQLDSVKIRRAQKVLRAKTQTETIERALDAVIAEHKRNQLAVDANERFVEAALESRMYTASWPGKWDRSFSTPPFI